ncbi:MAG: hypothetical protein ABWZ83_07615, partial [Mesorhizobium sp.]
GTATAASTGRSIAAIAPRHFPMAVAVVVTVPMGESVLEHQFCFQGYVSHATYLVKDISFVNTIV